MGNDGLLILQLQSLQLAATAELHLYKTMLKSKLILSAPALPSYISAKVVAAAQSQDTALLNVQARLFNSNPVKVALADTMNSIRATLGIENTGSGGTKKRLRAADYSSGEISTIETAGNPLKPVRALTTGRHCAPIGNAKSASLNVGEEYGASGSDNENSGSEESDNESFDMTAYNSRLAESSDADDLTAATEEDLPQTSPAGDTQLKYSPSRELSPSASPSPSVSSKWAIPAHSKPDKASSAPTKSTTFLPSLTMGGYISGSDSEISSSSSRRGSAATKSRKNRRGQQERRQIWEKKFGKNANHLKKSQNQIQNRDQGWDPRKGARDDDERGKRGNGRGRGRAGDSRKRQNRPSGGGPTISGANTDPVQTRRNANEKRGARIKQAERPLHPSWEAAKKAKDAKKNVTFQGKKVTFD